MLTAEGHVHEFRPTPKYPGLQYMESVQEGSNAYIAGLRSGDFITTVSWAWQFIIRFDKGPRRCSLDAGVGFSVKSRFVVVTRICFATCSAA